MRVDHNKLLFIVRHLYIQGHINNTDFNWHIDAQNTLPVHRHAVQIGVLYCIHWSSSTYSTNYFPCVSFVQIQTSDINEIKYTAHIKITMLADTERATMYGSMQPFFITSLCIGERLHNAIHCGTLCIIIHQASVTLLRQDKNANRL